MGSEIVKIGSGVTVELANGRVVSFTITSPSHNAALPRSGVVSSEAPIARAILGKSEDSYVSYEAGGLTHIVKIVKIEPEKERLVRVDKNIFVN